MDLLPRLIECSEFFFFFFFFSLARAVFLRRAIEQVCLGYTIV